MPPGFPFRGSYFGKTGAGFRAPCKLGGAKSASSPESDPYPTPSLEPPWCPPPCPECRFKAAPPRSGLLAGNAGQPSKNNTGSLFEVGLQHCRCQEKKCTGTGSIEQAAISTWESGYLSSLAAPHAKRTPGASKTGTELTNGASAKLWLSWSCRECLQGSSGGSFCVILASAHLVPAEKRIELFENGSTFLGQKP